jgi:hypothetical protein
MSNDSDLSPLLQATVQLHELYESLLAGGFTKSEAIRIIGSMLATGISDKPDA